MDGKGERKGFGIQAKMLAMTLAVFVLFAAATTYAWYSSLTCQATEASVNNLRSMMQISSESFETALKDINSVTALITRDFEGSINRHIFTYLMGGAASDAEMLKQRREAEDYLVSLCNFKTHLTGFAVYDTAGNSISYGNTMAGAEALEQDWYRQALETDEDVLFVAPHHFNPNRPYPSDLVFSIVRPIRHGGQVLGVVAADISCKLLSDMFNVGNINEYTMFVLDENAQQVIFPLADEQPELENTTWAALSSQTLDQGDEHFFTHFEGRESLAVGQVSPLTGWTTIAFVPRQAVLAGFEQARNQVLVITLLCGLLFVAAVSVLTFFVTRNLRRLSTAVAGIEPDSLELDVKIRSKDEAGQLYTQVQTMMGRIRRLITDIRRTEQEKRESELQALQAQINPHFLYNTLNTIKFLAALRGADNIQTVSENLSDMLRLTFDDRHTITVTEEVAYLKSYLLIQEYHYSGKFTVSFSVDEAAAGWRLPKLLLQPLVENAIRHGIAPKDDPGILQIRIYPQDGELVVRIKDDGVGMDEETVAALLAALPRAGHIGVGNTLQRLRLLYGGTAGFAIQSELGFYTQIEITLPIAPQEEGEHEPNTDR